MSPAQDEVVEKTTVTERKVVRKGDGTSLEGTKSAAPAAVPTEGDGHGQAAGHGEEIPTDLHRPGALMIIGVLLILIVLLAGIFAIGWFPHEKAEKQIKSDVAEKSSEVPTVEVEKPTRSPGSTELRYFCSVKPNQETFIYPRATGYLKKLYVDIQDRVKAGQLLAEIDIQEVDAQLAQSNASLAQSKADVVKAQSDLELAQRTYDRYKNVNGPGTVVTQQELDEKLTGRDNAASALAQANARVGVAEADVQRLTVLQGFSKVTAPFDGVITERNYDVGALLAPGNTGPGKDLFRLTQSDTVRVFVNIPQVEASNIHIGQEAYLTVRNYPGREFKGTVARAAGALDPATRTMPYELDFVNKDGALYSGMYGEAILKVTDAKPTMLVPTSALLFNAAGVQLAAVKDGKIHFQKVALGRDLGTQLEILGGLSDEDEIVTNPGARLAEGMMVEVMKPAGAEAGTAPAK